MTETGGCVNIQAWCNQ